MKRISFANVPGFLILILGCFVIFSWYDNLHTLIDISPNHVTVSLASGICFLICGAALFLAERFPMQKKKIYVAAGVYVTFFCLMISIECIYHDVGGIDLMLATTRISDGDQYTGSMEAASLIAFLLAASIFFLDPFSNRWPIAVLIQLLIFSLTLIGAGAMTGYLFDVQLLYNWYGFTVIDIYSAAGFTMLGLGLLLAWSKGSNFSIFYKGRDDKKILLVSILILLGAVFISNVTVFVAFARHNEESMRNLLVGSLSNKADIVNYKLNQVINSFDDILASDLVRRLMIDKGTLNDQQDMGKIAQISNLSAVTITDQSRHVVYSYGNMSQNPSSMLVLQTPYSAVFYHSPHGYILQLSKDIKQQGKYVGTVSTEWLFSLLNEFISGNEKASNNGYRAYICEAVTNNDYFKCLSALNSNEPRVVYFGQRGQQSLNQSTKNGNARFNVAFQKNMTMTSFQPIGAYGVGLLLNANMADFYQPILNQLYIALPLVLGTIGLGSLMFYLQVVPLVRRVVRLKKKALTSKLEMRTMMRHVAESEARFHSAFDTAPIGMAIVSVEGRVQMINPALCKIFGYDEAEFLQLNLKSITYPDDLEMTMSRLQEVVDNKVTVVRFEKRYYHKSGRLIWALVNASLIPVGTENTSYFIVQIQDISLQKEEEELLQYKAHYDTLTGLANRTMLEDSMNMTIAASQRSNKSFAVFFLDLDKFKEINDNLGHDAGDRLLQILAERLKLELRKNDIVARIGGDEFVLVLTELHDYKTAAMFAERIINSLLKPITIQRHELFVTASIGISFYPSDGAESSALLKSADNALYRAKNAGRNNYQFSASGLSKKIKDKMQFEQNLQQALAREEFKIYYLPILDAASSGVASVEALLRWQSGEFGLINPQQIIPVAEQTGLIVPLSEWIIKTACGQVKALRKETSNNINLTINISARHYMNHNIIDSIVQGLDATGFNPGSFLLEVNENLIMQDPALTFDILNKLRQYGIRIVVDNFGSGYSSLKYLQEFELDFIKIDRSLVQNIFSGPHSQTLLCAIITLAKNLDIKVIAEGVETKEQYEFMVENGCDQIQGYYICRPVVAHELSKFLQKEDVLM